MILQTRSLREQVFRNKELEPSASVEMEMLGISAAGVFVRTEMIRDRSHAASERLASQM